MLPILLFFHPQLPLICHIRAEADGCFLISRDAGHQFAVGKDFPGIQHPGLQKFRLRISCQAGTAGQTAAVAFGGKWDGEFQRPDAALRLRRIQHCDTDCAGDLRLSVPQLPAVYVDLSVGCDDTGDVRAVVRHDGLRRLLLGQGQFSPCLICVQARFFQFQIHEGSLPFPAVHVLLYEPPG